MNCNQINFLLGFANQIALFQQKNEKLKKLNQEKTKLININKRKIVKQQKDKLIQRS